MSGPSPVILIENNSSTYNDTDISGNGEGHHTKFQNGMILDKCCDPEWLENTVERIRLSLLLNSKRPTVDRRFYHDTEFKICGPLEDIIQSQLLRSGLYDDVDKLIVHCNKYLRILEYNRPGGGLSPHTDGCKVCEESHLSSTHTLLLYLANCQEGGETILLTDDHYRHLNNLEKAKNKKKKNKKKHIDCDDDNISSERNDVNESFPGWLMETNGMMSLNNKLVDTPSMYDEMLVKYEENTHIINLNDTIFGGIAITPQKGRILLFPHHWPHAGASVLSVPKIMLRAEITILYKN